MPCERKQGKRDIDILSILLWNIMNRIYDLER